MKLFICSKIDYYLKKYFLIWFQIIQINVQIIGTNVACDQQAAFMNNNAYMYKYDGKSFEILIASYKK